jgi:hypothetical protein
MKRRLKSGDIVTLTLPYSEVCMHLRVAGQVWDVQVLPDGAQNVGRAPERMHYSFPVTHGEAGIYSDAEGLYIQEEVKP